MAKARSVFKTCFIVIILISVIISSIGLFSVWYVLRPQNISQKDIDNTADENLVSITSFDGTKLRARLHRSDNNAKNWALLVHQYRSTKSAMSAYERWYYAHGYNTLTVDNRAHGASGGKFIGMGYLDQYDIRCWIDYIVKEYPDAEIILHGVSMGAAALMMLSDDPDVPSNVKVIIEDCGYTSAKDYLSWKLNRRFHLPSFPIIPIANAAFRLFAGYSMYDASAIDAVANSNIPILFIHGDKDETVPVEDVYALYEAANCEKELYIVPNAGHGEAVFNESESYWKTVECFVQHYAAKAK